MITLVLVKNPFSPQDGREVKQTEAGKTLAELLQENAMEGVELQATVNGYSVKEKTEIRDGDFVVIYPVVAKGGKGGKGILGIIAAIALSVVSFGVGGLVGAGAWGASMASWGVMGYVAAAAVMFLGSTLIGRMTGQKVDNGRDGDTEEATYSWGGVTTMEGQNNPVALTYGLVKSGGQTIGKYTMASGNNDYLYWLVAAGEGEVEIEDIRLNDNPIILYKDVEWEVRRGTNDQKIISFFGDTHFTQNLSYNMETPDTWYESTAQGSATEGLIIKIECPNGLFHGTDSGNLTTNTVYVQIQIHGSDSEWHDISEFIHTRDGWDPARQAYAISGSSTKAVRREYRIDRIAPDEYTVRVRVTGREHSDSTRDGFNTYWTGLSSIIYDDFIYPCTALLGIKAKATDQLSGSPALSFKKMRSVVYVYVNGEYTTKRADNPAWACYDILHQCRALTNINTGDTEFEVRGVPAKLIRYEDFATWAAFCDEKNYYVNIEIISAGELIDVCNEKVAPIGHGRVVRFGTKYGCIFAHEQEPVQMFGMGNIKAGTFCEEFLKIADRANSVEVTFTNKDAGYERDVIAVYGETYNSDGYAKTAQVTMDGITKFSQAYREGVYQLLCNKYQLRTVTFEADIDAIACTIGDVVIIAHDVPQWKNSGRVESVTGASVLLPCEVADTNLNYVLQWRESETDTMHEEAVAIVESGNGWTTVALHSPLATIHAGDVFSVAVSETENKLFTIQSITRTQEFTRQISCIEYDARVFEEPENYDGDDEKERVFTVTIGQSAHQTIIVTKYKAGVDPIEYTESFAEQELGWFINVRITSESGYVYGNLIINGEDYAYSIDALPLNRNYYIVAEESESGRVAYINGSCNRWNLFADYWYYIFYADPLCSQGISKAGIINKLMLIDMRPIPAAYMCCLLGSDVSVNYQDMCTNVLKADVSQVNVDNCERLEYAFGNCTPLQWVIGLENWKTPYLKNMKCMFVNTAIEYIDMHDWTTPNLVNVRSCFSGCTSLKIADISGINTSGITDASSFFGGNTALEYVIMDSYDIKFSGDIVMPEGNSTVKYLVKESYVHDYKEHPNWAARASRIDSISNYNIVRSNGKIFVTPKEMGHGL